MLGAMSTTRSRIAFRAASQRSSSAMWTPLFFCYRLCNKDSRIRTNVRSYLLLDFLRVARLPRLSGTETPTRGTPRFVGGTTAFLSVRLTSLT